MEHHTAAKPTQIFENHTEDLVIDGEIENPTPCTGITPDVRKVEACDAKISKKSENVDNKKETNACVEKREASNKNNDVAIFEWLA